MDRRLLDAMRRGRERRDRRQNLTDGCGTTMPTVPLLQARGAAAAIALVLRGVAGQPEGSGLGAVGRRCELCGTGAPILHVHRECPEHGRVRISGGAKMYCQDCCTVICAGCLQDPAQLARVTVREPLIYVLAV